MLVIVLFGLIAKSVLVSSACDAGTVTVNNFDWNQFTGPRLWYWLWHISTEQDEELDCLVNTYADPDGDSSVITTKAYNIREQRELTFSGHAINWTSNGYYEIFNPESIWTGPHYILAIDYDRYVIVKVCSVMLDEVFIYVGFRSKSPDQATVKDVLEDLREKNIDANQFMKWKTDHCQESETPQNQEV